MLEVAFVRSVEAHARIVSVDKSEAEALDGVAAVFCAADLADVKSFPDYIDYINPVRQRPLAETVRYVGAAYAAVVAADRYIAEDAAALVAAGTVYEPLPTVAGLDQALAPDAPKLFDHWDDNRSVDFPVDKPEVARAFAEADHTFLHRDLRQPAPDRPAHGVQGSGGRHSGRPAHGVDLHPEPPPRANHLGADAGRARASGEGGEPRHRGRVRHQDPRLPRGRGGAVDRPAARAAGPLDRGPGREPGDRGPRPGPAPRRGGRLRRRRHHPGRALHLDLRSGLGRDLHARNGAGVRHQRLHHRRLRLPEHGGPPGRGGHQQDPGGGLPRLRHPRGRVRDGADHRPGGPPDQHRPGGAAAADAAAPRPDAVRDARRGPPRLGLAHRVLRAGAGDAGTGTGAGPGPPR